SSAKLTSNAFQTIDRMNPQQLTQFLQNEHPQTLALILAHVTPTSAAQLLRSLPQEVQADIAVRMANLDKISSEVVAGISAVLEEKLKSFSAYSSEEADGVTHGGARAVAELFNRLGKSSRPVLERLDREKPEVASSIRQLMFIFEDIALLDDAAI